jgi:hypothetical protein
MKFLLIFTLALSVVSCNQPKNSFGRQFQTMIDQLTNDSTKLFGKYPINKPKIFILDPPLDRTTTNTLVVMKDTSILFRATIGETRSRSTSLKALEQFHQKIDHILGNAFKRDYEEVIPLTGYTNRTYRFTSKTIEIELNQFKSTLDNKYFVTLHVSKKPSKKYSSNQRHLFTLIDHYKKNYFAASGANEKENVRARFLDSMKHFLVDSLGRYIDSMTVTVDSVVQTKSLVTTMFHTEDIEFKYGMRFPDRMTPSEDSIYKFMRGFVPGQQVTVGFVHLGAGELNYPDDTTRPTMRIFAYPVPLERSK